MGGHGVVQCRRVVVYRCIDHVGLYQGEYSKSGLG